MLPYQFASGIFLRFPVYSFENYKADKLQEVMDTPFFRMAIYFGSRQLYREAELKNFCCAQMNTGMQQSLLKYYNRMCYRATPFGMFSGFACTAWNENQQGLFISEQEELSLQADFRISAAIGNIFLESQMSDDILYYSNTSLYTFGKELRYIKRGCEADMAEQGQGIAAVDKNSLLCRLLEISRNGIKRQELSAFLEHYAGEQSSELLKELEAEGLIFNSAQPNVTGESYLRRLGKLSGNSVIAGLAQSLEKIRLSAEVNVPELEELVKPFEGLSRQLRHPFYVNYQKNVRGGVDVKHQHDILEGLYCLGRMQQGIVPDAMSRFQTDFTRRFEDREIPLMLALDPEAGLGYEQLEQPVNTGELLNGITFTGPVAEKVISWGPVQELLLGKMYKPASQRNIITITDQDINELPESQKSKYSPGISVMFRIHGQKVFIEEAGGASATSLPGRFSAFSEELLNHARSIADKEQEQNPHIVFAEIAHFTEEHAANINTREHIRRYEIPVLVHSTLPAEQVISLNDLYVSVREGQVMIRSGRLNKRVIPRLSTAYNYKRSELPVFRFLCDLQYHGLASSFSLNPERLLPGLNFYPRIEYKNCVLSPAIWILNQEDVSSMLDADDPYSAFLKLAGELNLKRYFALSSGDRQLVFDSEEQAGIEMFLAEARNEKRVIIKEFFLPGAGESLLKNEQGEAYVHQMVAALTCTQESYSSENILQHIPLKIKRNFAPGDEWLYFKIYCAPQNADYILTRKLFPLLKKYLNCSEIDQWFFIRYYDPGHHLRLRVKAGNTLIKDLPGLLSRLLKPLIESGIISNLSLDTYRREIERYGPKTIVDAERAFMSSSELVIAHLQENKNEFETIQFAMFSADALLNSFDIAAPVKLELLEHICTGLMNELGEEKQLRDDLNRKYREHQQAIWSFMAEGKQSLSREEILRIRIFKKDLCTLRIAMKKYEPGGMRRCAADMLHMHMNRIFSAEQRKKELVIYYLTLRFYLSLQARKRGYSVERKVQAIKNV